jgi:hypothetical protein
MAVDFHDHLGQLHRTDLCEQRIAHRFDLRRRRLRFELAERQLVLLDGNDPGPYGLGDLLEPIFELLCVLGDVLLGIQRQSA